MPMKAGYSEQAIRDNISLLINEGMTQAQAVAAAYSKARVTFKKRYPKKSIPAYLKPKRNPAMKKKAAKKSVVKKRRTPAQIAATKKLVALNKKRKSTSKKKVSSKRRTMRKSNPVKKKARVSRHHVLAIVPSAAGLNAGLNPKTIGYWTGTGWDTLKSKAVKYPTLDGAKKEAFHMPKKYRPTRFYAFATETA